MSKKGSADEPSLRARLISGSLGSMSLYVSSKLLMFLASVLLAQLLGAEGYGVFASATALAMVLGVFASLGLPVLVVRLVAAYGEGGRWSLMRGLLRRCNQLVASTAIAMAAIGAIVIAVQAERLGVVRASAFYWAMSLLPLMALGSLRSAALRGLHFVVLGQVPESFVMPVTFVVCLGVTDLVIGQLNAANAVAARVLATGLAFAIGAIFLARKLPSEFRQSAPSYEMVYWVQSAMPLLFVGGMSIITAQTDVLMLAALSTEKSAGIYQSAARGAELVAFSLVIVNVVIQPTISQLHANGEFSRLQRLVSASSRVMFAASLPIAVMLSIFAGPLLAFAFGAEFERGATALAILCAGFAVSAGLGSPEQVLTMTGNEGLVAIGLGIGAAANVLLNWMLIPAWDIFGAATATAISLVAGKLVLAVFARRRLGIRCTAFGF